jgi:hypothetical protein
MPNSGCQMVYVHTKNPNLSLLLKAFELKFFGIFYGHFGILKVVWYIFSRYGMLHLEKYGNPVLNLWDL